MAKVGKVTTVGIAASAMASTSAATLINFYTDVKGLALAILMGVITLIQACIYYLMELVRVNDDEANQNYMLARLIKKLPFSKQSRNRADKIRILRANLVARRQTRLKPLVPESRLNVVLEWMSRSDEPIVDIPAGELRVLIGAMGAGKTERATRWIEEAIDHASTDPSIEVPVWLRARDAARGLEAALHDHLGHEFDRPCRIVIDDLDSVGFNEADGLLDEARQLLEVWPQLTILATSRPGVRCSPRETIHSEPWPVERGVNLTRLILEGELPHQVWATETRELFTSPLLALAMAKRMAMGGGAPNSRLELLSGIASDVLRSERPEQASAEIWANLAQLAARLLQSGHPIRFDSLGNEARIWELTATRLVVEDGNHVTFALPLFEQHFAAQALKQGIVGIEQVGGPTAFPRWRYAIAFACSTSDPDEVELLFNKLASINAAAASWLLDELPDRADTSGVETVIEEQSVTVGTKIVLERDGASRSVMAGLWLREAMQSFLSGFGPVAETLADQYSGTLTQWGFSLTDHHAIRAVARHSTPPPDVIEISSRFDDIRLADGWRRVEGFDYPNFELGRRHWARSCLRKSLGTHFERRTLPSTIGTAIDRERLWFMATFVAGVGPGPPVDPRNPDVLRERVADMVEQSRGSVRMTWTSNGQSILSEEIVWLRERLQSVSEIDLRPTWPEPDLRPAPGVRWLWERYSPELMHETAVNILREAISGYYDIVSRNFPQLGNALGLYSIRPVRLDGALAIPTDRGTHAPWLGYLLRRDPAAISDNPSVHLDLSDVDTSRIFDSLHAERHDSVFYNIGARGMSWPVGKVYAVTDISYRWLVHDLELLGLLDEHFRFD